MVFRDLAPAANSSVGLPHRLGREFIAVLVCRDAATLEVALVDGAHVLVSLPLFDGAFSAAGPLGEIYIASQGRRTAIFEMRLVDVIRKVIEFGHVEVS